MSDLPLRQDRSTHGRMHNMRLSGLQREVLSLYRKCLREARKKPTVSSLLSRQSSPGNLTTSDRTFSRTSRATLGMLVDCGNAQVYELTETIIRRAELMKSIALDKKDFSAIEYLLRRGQRQLDIYASPGIRNILR